jgi:hypothetical protein
MWCSVELLTLQQNEAATNVQRGSHHLMHRSRVEHHYIAHFCLICVSQGGDLAGATHRLLEASSEQTRGKTDDVCELNLTLIVSNMGLSHFITELTSSRS